ncbi:hypothetical protein PENSPDRAFT_735173 [Peniophora sp. CONT]|nr:hypothetical protein PENSPDRAFT_735173 [Peniophora sp. CONT]
MHWKAERELLSLAEAIDIVPSPIESGTLPSLSSISSEEVGSSALSSRVMSPFSLPPGMRKHEQYHFEHGNVRLLVDNMLYNVSRTILTRHSSWFRERLSQPARALPPDWTIYSTARGEDLYVNHEIGTIQAQQPDPLLFSCPKDTFYIYGATAPEFDALLTVLLPNVYTLTKEQWTAVLKLSTMWKFSSVRTLAIRYLKPMLSVTPLERLITARTYDVHSWVEGTLRDLVKRDMPLHKAEAARLSLADVVRIHQSREACATKRVTDDLRKDPLFAKAFGEMGRQSASVREMVREASPKAWPLGVIMLVASLEVAMLLLALCVYLRNRDQ